MKLKALPTTLGIGLCSLALSVNAASNIESEAQPEDLFSSPFDHCFTADYTMAEASAEQAHATAECFTSLLNQEETSLGANKLTIMQYSASWYEAAAEKGYQGAQENFEANIVALTLLEQQTRHSFSHDGQEMLAAEKKFDSLDVNDDGLLSIAEASHAPDLKNSFSQSDFDSDGMLSYGEYTIVSGEYTAAGH